jgi:eukaryotic-like serine/threonine-protein kinase
MSTKTGAIRPVTDDASEDWDPCFTRDGKGVFWSSNRTGHFEIWTAQADGSGARQVTHNNGDSENPVVSPDGKWIAYAEYSAGRAGLWKCRVDGSEPSRVVAGSFEYPEISPDGEYIAGTEFGADPTAPVDLRVFRFADGKPTAFHAIISNWQTLGGRDRWLRGGKAIGFTGLDDRNAVGIFAQEFDPRRDTSSTRHPLLAFDRNIPIETFGVSPDGKRLIVEGQESTSSLLLIEGIPGIAPPQRSR